MKFVLSISVCLLCSVVIAGEFEWTYLDFNSPLALKAERKGATMRLCESPWEKGKKAAIVTYGPWQPGPPDWPVVIAPGPILCRPPKHAEIFDHITFKARNIGKSRAYWGLHFRNYTGGRWAAAKAHYGCELAPGEEKEFFVDISGLQQAFGLGSISQFHLFTENPRQKMELIFSDIKLTPAFLRKMAQMTKDISSLRRWVANTIPAGKRKDNLFRHINAQAEKLSALQKRLENKLTLEQAWKISREFDEIKKNMRWIKSEPGRIRAEEFVKAHGLKTDWLIGVESSMTKVAYEALPFTGRFNQPMGLDAAKGEVVHGQLVIVPLNGALKDVQVVCSDLHDGQGNRIKPKVFVVGYVFTHKPGNYDVAYEGWWPDLLLDYIKRFNVPTNAQQAIWLMVDVPRNAKAGQYKGTISVKPANRAIAHKVDVNLKVRSFAIPRERHLKLALNYDERQGPWMYKHRWNDDMKWKFRNFILDHRLNVDSIYEILPMWKESVADLKRLKQRGQNFFSVAVFNNTSAKGFEKKVETFLAKAKAAGIPESQCWFYGFDEVGEERVKELNYHAGVCKKRWPGVKILTTALYPAMKDAYKNVDGWVPCLPEYKTRKKFIVELRKKGKQAWYYFCIGPAHPYPNNFVEYPPIDQRLMFGFMARKTKSEGILHYYLNRVMNNKRPVSDGPLTSWVPSSFDDYNGDGCWMAYGENGPISTIRLENIRDGIEDYETNWLLEALLAKANGSGKNAKKIAMLSQALKIPDSLIRELDDYTYNPDVIQRYRKKMYDAIEQLIEMGYAVP